MNFIEYQKILQAAKNGEIRLAYLLIGDNDFLKQEFISCMKSRIIDKNFEATDKLIVYGDDIQDEAILWLFTLPFKSVKKLLVIKHAELMPQHQKKALQKWLKQLTSNSGQLKSQTCLPTGKTSSNAVVILTTPKKKKSNLKAELFENVVSYNCSQLFDNEIPGWVNHSVKKDSYDIDFKAIQLLQHNLGNDLYALFTELKKIMDFIKPKKSITLQDVQEIGSNEIAGTKYQLADAIAEKKLSEAQRLLKLLYDLGEKPSYIIYTIQQHFDRLFRLKEHPDEYRTIPRNFWSKYKKQVGLRSHEDMLNAFSSLYKTDFAVKTSRADKEFLVQELVYRLC